MALNTAQDFENLSFNPFNSANVLDVTDSSDTMSISSIHYPKNKLN